MWGRTPDTVSSWNACFELGAAHSARRSFVDPGVDAPLRAVVRVDVSPQQGGVVEVRRDHPFGAPVVAMPREVAEAGMFARVGVVAAVALAERGELAAAAD